jgi:2,5-diamino-6-(ribosylamino)-4(3H)-pyrimidinone 5'-phosphate reductase
MAPPGLVRPHVTIVCAASLDGKLSTARRDPVRFTSRADRARLHALEDASDAILIGAGTLRAEDPPLLPTPERRAARVARGLAPNPLRVVLSASLDLPLGRSLAPTEKAPVHVFQTRGGPETGRARLEAHGIDVVAGPSSPESLAGVLALLERLGVRRLLCVGGGNVNARLFEEDLVDEVKLTVCPVLIGGKDAPTLFDGTGFPADRLRRATLVRQEVSSEGELFLDYQILK